MSRRMGMLLLGLVCCVAATGGCAGKRVDLVESGKARVDVVQAPAVDIYGVTVQQGRQDVHVSGLVRDDGLVGRLSNSHINVEVLGPDGRILWSDAVRLPLWRTQRAGPDYRFFHAYIPGQLTEGASVRVRWGMNGRQGDKEKRRQGATATAGFRVRGSGFGVQRNGNGNSQYRMLSSEC